MGADGRVGGTATGELFVHGEGMDGAAAAGSTIRGNGGVDWAWGGVVVHDDDASDTGDAVT